MVDSSGTGRGTVTLRIPASSAYLSLARTATASTCARMDFTVDRLEDVGLAVDEALSLLLLDARPGTQIECRWTPENSGILVELRSHSSSGRTPRTTTFAWTVLAALVDQAAASIEGGVVTLSLRTQRAEAVMS
jgi:serine/threonine-protein kinase RsbW